MTTENNDIDPRVSGAYRDLASETTPPDLDRTILSMAAGTARSRYGKARVWVRPVAWAATIGLSLAFVLELSQVPDKAPLSAGGSDGDTFEVLEDNVVRNEAAASAKSETAVRQEQDAASADFDADDMSLLKQAEEQARLQSGEPRTAARAAELPALLESKERLEGCDTEARASAQTWYACIKALRESGLPDIAAVELETLRAEFPDFQEPAPSR